MEFEPYQTPIMLGPLMVRQALSQVPIFGEHKSDIDGLIQKALQPHYAFPQDYTEDTMVKNSQLPEISSKDLSTAEKLQKLRGFSRKASRKAVPGTDLSQSGSNLDASTQSMDELLIGRAEPPSHRQLHEKLLSQNIDTRGLPKEAHILLDHIMLLRAHNRYLFDATINRDVVSDDPWLRDLWDWINGMSNQLPPTVLYTNHYRR
jgi:WD repeat-containing protein mio